MLSRAEHIFSWGTKISLFTLAFLGFVIYPNILYPDVFTKGLYVRFFIELAAAGFLWLLAIKKAQFGKFTPLSWAILAFSASLIISMVVSPSIYRSFWGEAQRMEGVFGLLHYVLLFFVARAVFQKKDWLWYFKLTALTAPFLVLYAILQYISSRTGASIPFVFNPSGNPGSLFGNPAFFSMFLIFAAGFSLCVYFMEAKRSWKIFSLAITILSLLTITWLGIRGEVLGALLGAFAFWGLFAWWKNDKKQKKLFGAISLSGILLAVLLFALQGSLFNYYPRLLQRIINLPNEPSFATRALSLRSSAKAFMDSPKTMLIGWGPEHFITGYNKYYDPKHGTYEDVWFDRAHNKLADVLVTTGILGILSYLSIFGIIAWYLFRLRRSEPMIAAAAGGLVAAYFAQNLTLFDLPQSYVNFFLLAAFLDTTAYPQEKMEGARMKQNPLLLGGAIFGSMAVIIAFAYTIFIPLNQSRLYLYYLRTHEGNELVKNIGSIFRPRNFAHYTLLDDFWRRLQVQEAFRKQEFSPLTDAVIEEIEYLIRREPSDAAMLLRLADIYTERGIGLGSSEDFKKGEEYARRATALSPGRQEIYYLLAFNLQGQKQPEEAVKIMRETVALNPETKKAHYTLGMNLALAGDLKGAVEEIEYTRKGGWFQNFREGDVKNIVTIYAAAGRQDLLLEVYASALAGGIVTHKDYYIVLLRALIQKEDKAQVLYWAEAYKKAYPEFTSDIQNIIEFAKNGAWDDLKKL